MKGRKDMSYKDKSGIVPIKSEYESAVIWSSSDPCHPMSIGNCIGSHVITPPNIISKNWCPN